MNTLIRPRKPLLALFMSLVSIGFGQIYNRDNGIDSRRFGTVPLADVVGRVRQIWFSYAEGTIRWGRMGKVIE